MAITESYRITETDKLKAIVDASAADTIAGKLRQNGLSRFVDLGIPTQNQEAWRFISFKSLSETPFTRPVPGATACSSIERAQAEGLMDLYPNTIVFVDGFFREELSSLTGLPAGVAVSKVESVEDSHPVFQKYFTQLATNKENPFLALNEAFFSEAVFVYVEPEKVAELPLHVLYLVSGDNGATIITPRLLVVAEKSSQLSIIETFIGPDFIPYLHNGVTEIVNEENVVVDHYRVNFQGNEAYHLSSLQSRVGRYGNFSSQEVTFGSKLSRNDILMHMDGENGIGTMNGLFQIAKNQIVDNHTSIDHAYPNCETHELFKGILHDSSRGVFNGHILVRQIAQKTDSKQTNRALILSSDALMNTNPQLEIFADDVKCTHGATIGQLDEQQLFYLRSRGISHDQANRMLIYAFANNLVQRIKLEPLRELIERKLLATQEDSLQLTGA